MGNRPLITICVGHTALKPGALAASPLSIHEYEYNSRLASVIFQRIKFDFDSIIVFRDGLTVAETYEGIEMMKPAGNIELHFNSALNSMARGTETLCVSRWQPYAGMIQAALCSGLDRTKWLNRGVKVLKTPDDRGFGSCSQLDVPNVIIEPFFGSSPIDAELGLKSMDVIAESLHKALQVYFLYDSDGSE